MSTQGALIHFEELSDQERIAVMRRMAADGVGVYAIAAAAGVAVEQVRRIVAGTCEACGDE